MIKKMACRKINMNFKVPLVVGLLSLLFTIGYAEPDLYLFDPLGFHSAIRLPSGVWHPGINPCWSVQESLVTKVGYSAQNVSGAGDFHRVLDPGRISDTYWTAWGSKRLGGTNLFSGSFSYRLSRAAEKFWSQNRQPYSGLPFVLADSSCGDWELNGLMWQVEISRVLLKDWLYGGVAVFYNVDEEYQNIFPRPRGNHRDIVMDAGIGAAQAERWRIGITLKYYNFQESLKTSGYSLDQEKTPIFYKVRGLDMPLVFRGQTSEERLYSIAGTALSVDGMVHNFRSLTIDFAANLGTSIADNVDGGAYPIEQGSWDDEYASYVLALTARSGLNVQIVFFSSGFYRFQSANHPDLRQGIYHETVRRLSGGIGLNLGSAAGWRVAPALEMTSKLLKREDSFNGILDYFPGTLWRGYLMLDIPEHARLDFATGIGFDSYFAGKSVVYEPPTSGFYYQTVTVVDQQYYGTDFTAFRLFEKLTFGRKRRFFLELEYLRTVPREVRTFKYREQVQMRFAVEDPLQFK